MGLGNGEDGSPAAAGLAVGDKNPWPERRLERAERLTRAVIEKDMLDANRAGFIRIDVDRAGREGSGRYLNEIPVGPPLLPPT